MFAWKGIEPALASGGNPEIGKLSIIENARGEHELKLMLTKGVESASTGIVHNFNAVTSDRCPSMVALDLKEDKMTHELLESTIEGTIDRTANSTMKSSETFCKC